MSHCEEYAALLDGFVDGELSVREAERVRTHLEGCPDCQAYVDDALAIRAAFPELEEVQVPEGFSQRVMDRVADTPQKKSVCAARRRSRRIWGGAAAAACVALLLQAVLHSGGLQAMRAHSDTAAQTASDGVGYHGSVPESAAYDEDGAMRNRSVQEDEAAFAGDAWNNGSTAGVPAPESDAIEILNPLEAGGELPAASAGDAPDIAGVSAAALEAPEAPESSMDQSGVAAGSLSEMFQTISTPLEQSPRVELSAEQRDLLTGCTPLTDETGRSCYLLERTAYDALLLSLAERNASQPTALYTPESVFGAEETELPPVVVYLIES